MLNGLFQFAQRPIVIFAVVVMTYLGQSTGAYAQSISSIEVTGNRRIESETIRSFLAFERGERYSSGAVDDSLKSLFATGLFSDVKINLRGRTVVVAVKENPIIRKLAFEGNSKLEDEQLTSVVQSKGGGVYSRARIESDTLRMIEVYRRVGRYNVKISPKTIRRSQGRVDVVFEINEGSKAGIKTINFVGNEVFSDSDLLDEITTTESNFLSFIKTSDVYDPDRLDVDKELIKRFYLSQGYADFRILSAVADFDREENAFYVTFNLSEGPLYRFGEIDIESTIPDVKDSTLWGLVEPKEGDIYSVEEIEETLEAITVELSERGYVFSRVRPAGDRDFEKSTIGITFQIDEGSRVYIERINIKGNTATEEYVIRREFEVAEGDAYNKTLIDKAVRQLNGLGFFKTVNVTREAGSAPDKVIVNIAVEEQNTGSLRFGAAYSSQSGSSGGVSGTVALEQRNFLGRGQRVKLSATYSRSSTTFDFSFTEPRLLDTRVAGTFSAHNTVTSYTSYDIQSRGAGLSVGLPIADDVTLILGYAYRNQNVEIKVSAPSNALRDIEGRVSVHDLNYALIVDKIDNRSDPKNGLYGRLDQKLGNVGTDRSFIETTIDLRGYKEVFKDVVLVGRARAGHQTGVFGKNGPPINESFFFGNDLVRGFQSNGFGPRDISTSNNEQLGGTLFYGASAEVQLPIWGLPEELGLRWALFADIGSLINPSDRSLANVTAANVSNPKTARASVGASILWRSPVGPVRFDFSKVLKKGPFDETQSFSFGGGTSF